ncbi:unnamed protein product, partial [Didymodactylos carnosus]
NLELVTYHQETLSSISPKPGWVEQDPIEILETTKLSIGVTNQRETTILWDKNSGKPLHNALVWLDARTQETVDFLLEQSGKDKDCLQDACGLPISTYFSALKIRWLIDNVPNVQKAIEQKRCLFGTVDTWLLWNLILNDHEHVHVTDVTNASRTMLMNIRKLTWDSYLCNWFGIPEHILPTIKSSSGIFGYISEGALKGIPISAVLGDQQAALVGQKCWTKGSAKSTYGTGCFILYNTGEDIAYSRNGLLTTVAYKWNDEDPVYALEGSIAIAGQCIKWLRDNLEIIPDAKSTGKKVTKKKIATSVEDAGGVYFVPAFSGLFAPYWRSDARGVICGITQYTTKAHIIRAALEGISYQTREVVDAMYDDSHVRLARMQVDGGMAENQLFLQMLANIVGIPIAVPSLRETTALGAALGAGKAKGIDIFTLDDEHKFPITMETYVPRITGSVRDDNFAQWKKAVIKSFERIEPPKQPVNKGVEQNEIFTSQRLAWMSLVITIGVLGYMITRK